MEQTLLARQPIVDREISVFAYELLFRSGLSSPTSFDGNVATATVAMGTLMDMGLDRVAGSLPVFVNLTRAFFERELYVALPPDRVVLEVLEDIEPDDVMLAAVQRAKQRGYRIALDDYVHDESMLPMLELADIVKVDVQLAGLQAAVDYVERLRRPGLLLLAEKVETYEQFQLLLAAGYDLFQGWFYARPDLLRRSKVTTDRTSLLQLLATLQDPELEFEEIGALVERNLPLSSKLLRYVNSALYSLPTEIQSIRHACTMLGRERVHSCVQLLLLTEIGEKPSVLVTGALARARMCQLQAGDRKAGQGHFTVGLFSLLDAYMDRPLDDLLSDLPLADEVKQAILARSGDAGVALNVAEACERADWDALEASGVDLALVQSQYLEALEWSQKMLAVIE